MADPTIISKVADVIKGWNEKLELTDEKLSSMVPFCDLYAIFKGNYKSNDTKEAKLIESGFPVQLKNYGQQLESFTLVPVFNILEQQTGVFNDELVHPRGVGGIESCNVQTWDANLGTYIVTLQIVIPSFDKDIRISSAMRKLAIMGTEWIIAYGWARDSSRSGKPFSPMVNNVIDLTSSHHGYYKFLKCVLKNFTYSMDSNRVVSGTLTFVNGVLEIGMLAAWNVYRKNIRELLTSSTSTLISCCQDYSPFIFDQLKRKNGEQIPVFYNQKREVWEPNYTLKDAKIKVIREEPGYYSLGWIIEAMRQAIEDLDPKFWRVTIFEKWIDPKTTKIMTNADSSKEPNDIICSSIAEVPISIKDLDCDIDLATNESILWSIDRVCYLANQQLLGAAEISVEIADDGSTILIRDINDTIFNVANRADSMKLGASTPNSLLLGIELGTKLNINLTWGMNWFITNTQGASVLYNMFEKEANGDKKDDDPTLSETARLIRKFKKDQGNNEALDVNRFPAGWQSYLEASTSDKNIEKIVTEITTNQTVPIGLALRNFFTCITAKIHGTAMVPYMTQLEVTGLLPGIDGRYGVMQTTDSLTPGSFTTELLAHNISPDPKGLLV